MSQQTTPPSRSFSKHYETRLVTLTTKPLFIPVQGDFIDVISTNADLSKVYIWFNEQDSNPRLPLNNALGAQTPFHRIILDWEDSENNKTITLLIGREFSFRVLKSIVQLAGDLVGLARESTLRSLHDMLAGVTASDYDIISLDLSMARSDALVAQNVIFLKVLESTTPTAQYSLKLFDTTKKPITQSILPPGAQLERLRRARVYISNPAQPSGTRLDLLVFMG